MLSSKTSSTTGAMKVARFGVSTPLLIPSSFLLSGLGEGRECSECRTHFFFLNAFRFLVTGLKWERRGHIVLVKTDGIHGPRSRKSLTSQQG